MSDSEDVDLENLRQLALSSLLKRKAAPQQTNAVFYRPVSNTNLISIQPVNGINEYIEDEDDRQRSDDEDDDSNEESSSGSEYAVVEEGLSVSSGDVDEVIEQVVSDEEIDSRQDDEEEVEDAVSIASHDSFDEILNSVEAEINQKPKPVKRPSTDRSIATGPTESKRPRPNHTPLDQNTTLLPRRNWRSPIRDSYHRDRDSSRPGSRRHSPPSPRHRRGRERRSNSPRMGRRYHSPLRRRRQSPADKSKPNFRRESPSPIISRHSRDSKSRSGSRPKDLRRPACTRSQGGSDGEKSHRRRSPQPAQRRRSRSPRNELSFGDHRLRELRKQSSRQNSRSPKRQRSKSPPRVRRPTKSPSPGMDLSQLPPEERAKVEKRRRKFESEPSQSGKVILKQTDQSTTKTPKIPIMFESEPKDKNQPIVSSRLGRLVKTPDRDHERTREQKPKTIDESTKDVDVSNNNSPTRSNFSVGEDDLRTKIQQKRAANARIFSAALKDMLHKETFTK